MVRREGTRFGVNTSQSVRRLPRHYQRIYASQSVVVETKLSERADEVHRAIRKQSKAAVKRQLQRGAFDDQEYAIPTKVEYSLNKAKRWEVIEDIKESENLDNHSIVIEHHALPRPCRWNARTCVGVFDSVDRVERLPKKKYARVNDLMKDVSGQQSKEEDEDFGKKNRRRSRKGKGVHQEQEKEGHVPLAVVEYDVTLAAPKHTYQTYCNTVGESGRGQRKRNSRIRTGKVAQCNVQDAFSYGLWQMEEEEEFLVEEMEDEMYWQEETKDATPYQLCTVAMETLINRALPMGSAYKKEHGGSAHPQREVVDTKGKVFPLDEQDGIPYFTRPSDMAYVTRKLEKQKRRQRRKLERALEGDKRVNETVPVPEKPSLVVSVNTDDINSTRLEGHFGSRYVKGLCIPRRFAINLTDPITDQLQSKGSDLRVASMLQQTGHHVFAIVDCTLESQLVKRRDPSQLEEVRVKVCGLKEDQEFLTNALTGLDSTDFSDVISAVSNSVMALPLESFLTESSIKSVATKPALTVETVKSVLGWHYDVTNVNKATEETLVSNKTEDHEFGDEFVCGEASNDCESCGICFQAFDEALRGTALIGCSHWFCEECWRGHLIARVGQGDTNITCPEFKCTSAVDRVTMMSLLPSELYAHHHANKANVALMLQRDHHWCPSPRCGRLLRLGMADLHRRPRMTGADARKSMVPVFCECGRFWCSECKEEAHWPATCEQAKVYRKEARKAVVDKHSERIKVDTKACPRCRYPIEKSYGCDYMQCKCGHAFCWYCGESFQGGHYFCVNKYSFKTYIIGDDLIATSAIELAILHHRKRSKFACHSRSRKARRLALKMAYPHTSSTPSDSDIPANRGSLTPSSSARAAGGMGQCPQLERARTLLADVASFLSEAEFVLEHLEILLSKTSRSIHRGVLSQHKTRLIFITDILHKVLDEQEKLDMGKIDHQLHCGKSCLKLIAVAATQLASSMAPASMEE